MPVRVEIVCPERRHVDQSVDMAVLPGRKGDIAAMPGRAPMMLQLNGGVVSFYEADQVIDRFFVSGGFADMGANHCTILADTVRRINELDPVIAQERMQSLEMQWARIEPSDIEGLERIELDIQSLRAELEAVKAHKPGG